MSISARYDIVLQTTENPEQFQDFLQQLVETLPNEACKIIIWNRHNQEQMLLKWKDKFASVVVCNSGSEKLSELVQNDMVLLNSEMCLRGNWLQELEAFAYKTPETATVNPLVEKRDADIQAADVNLENIRLYEHIWTNTCETNCLFIKKNLVAALRNYLLQDLFSPEWVDELKKNVTQLGYQQEVCDSLMLQHQNLSTEYESDYDYPEVFDNIRMHSNLNSDKKNILLVIQADFSEDASNNIGGTQLHVKDIVFGIKDKYQVFVAARDGDFLRVTAYLKDKQLVFKFYIGKPTEKPVFYDAVQRKLFRTILNAFSINLVHVHHTYSFSMEIYEEAAELNIPIILTLHDFYFLCPTIKMFDNKNVCCIGNDNEGRCRECLSKLMGINDNLSYIAHWRDQTYKILQLCKKIIVPSENAKKIFSQYFPGIADSIQVIEHGYDVPDNQNLEIITTSCVHENIEVINQDGQCTEIRGWALYAGANNNAGKIYLDITDSSGRRVRVPTYKMERGDVAQGDSKNLKTGFLAYVPNCGLESENLKIKIIVTVEGQNYSSDKAYDLKKIVTKNTDNLRVAFIGGLSLAKGSRQIYDIIQKGIEGIDWYIFGGIDDERLQRLKKKSLTWTNFYQRDDLALYLDLHKIDVIVILSLWPETFCYTLSEAIAYKRPVIVTEVGALGERTMQMQCGWVVPLNQIVPDVTAILERIKTKSNEFEIICDTVQRLELRSLKVMNQYYLKLYEEMNCTRHNSRDYDAKQVYFAWQERLADDGKQGRVIPEKEYQAYIVKLEQDIQQLVTSRSYKLAKRISGMWFRLKGKRR